MSTVKISYEGNTIGSDGIIDTEIPWPEWRAMSETEQEQATSDAIANVFTYGVMEEGDDE